MKWIFAFVALGSIAYGQEGSEIREFARSTVKELEESIAGTRQAYQRDEITKTEWASANLEYFQAKLAVARIEERSQPQPASRSVPSSKLRETLHRIVEMRQILFDDLTQHPKTSPREKYQAKLALREAQLAFVSSSIPSQDTKSFDDALQQIVNAEYAELRKLQREANVQGANVAATILYQQQLITQLCALTR
jgi:hypothetical protein